MIKYNKLVRDGIPALIASQGKACTTRVMDNGEYIEALRAKLREEAEEYFKTEQDKQSLEELADLLEVIHALAAVHGGDREQLEQIRTEKAERRGAFTERIFLLQAEE
ncbi:phosphoribosyl-ATP pyrophosphohydrolase [Paenibacillus sp. FSL R7-0273]|uniref:nucleoside triphosphate pyrophosphohydrolase n=1 Tax=Paenibacillus sp. FSL R7-0273 TaxID=1536772 RepID=UPI0004F741AE|nr:nucleoside triphosphate pyrophosphohydrolase [Paenibacillus sp. FSL R7-0273]AIQ45179.1 phosphoribosyl-ATP pyrophosphohydrolase [Paenibacillus sp. FSL R7-0273]OMF85696.1 phosphoribosyl-ATP pyrophosphohydrolase [Paenibacillus sp. FSL R7-0273]